MSCTRMRVESGAHRARCQDGPALFLVLLSNNLVVHLKHNEVGRVTYRRAIHLHRELNAQRAVSAGLRNEGEMCVLLHC